MLDDDLKDVLLSFRDDDALFVPNSVLGSDLVQRESADRVTVEEFRRSANAVLGGRAGAEVFRLAPRSIPPQKLPLLRECFNDALERFVCSCDVPTTDADLQRIQSSAHAHALRFDRSLIRKYDLVEKIAATTPVLDISSKSEEAWEALVADQKCSLCIDLLAAPVILECSHSFCGGCLHNYLGGATMCGEIGSDSVISSCPVCRSEINSPPIYERNLDTSIVSKTKEINASGDQFLDWQVRRETYLQVMRDRDRHREDRRRRQKSSVQNDADSDELDPPFDSIETFLKWALPVVAVLIICVITAARNSSKKR
jgi:hypothetical protein